MSHNCPNHLERRAVGFFDDVLPANAGWVPIINFDSYGRLVNFRWFNWPAEADGMAEYVSEICDGDVYFSPMLYTKPPTRTANSHAMKRNVSEVAVLWADGDAMDITRLRCEPTTIVKSSRDHWQAYWRISDAQSYTAKDIEDLNHGMFNVHKDDGMDRGWHLAKLLRVPFTLNTKPEYGRPWEVEFDSFPERALTYAEYAAEYEPASAVDFSSLGDLKPPPEYGQDKVYDILSECGSTTINNLFADTPAPGSDWSGALYHMLCLLFESGRTVEEAFIVANEAACNKFARDGRDEDLWPQVHRDYERWKAGHPEFRIIQEGDALVEKQVSAEHKRSLDRLNINDGSIDGLYWSGIDFLRDDEEEPMDTFIDLFTTWAQTKSRQSPADFNKAGAVTLLAATLAKYGRLPLSFGDMGLNVFILVLGRTTQSRKSTALRLAMSIIKIITDGDTDRYTVPGDATSEALVEHLSTRPRESSVMVIDEVQDTFKQVNKKGSYTSGLVGALTYLYDGEARAVLRKTSAQKVTKGVPHWMSLYGTGILNLSADALEVGQVESGFVPRCAVVVDQRTGFEPGAEDIVFRDPSQAKHDSNVQKAVAATLARAIKFWDAAKTRPEYELLQSIEPRVALECTSEAFRRWQDFAMDVTTAAATHPLNPKALFPTCERLSYTVLRVAGLLAMVECKRTIEMKHVLKAIALGTTWARCTEILVARVCETEFTREVAMIERFVADSTGSSVTYADLLTKFQSKFSDPRLLTRALEYSHRKGTLVDQITGPRKQDRKIVYVRK